MAEYEELIDQIIENHQKAGASLWDAARDVHTLFTEHGRMEAEFMSILTSQMAVGRDSIYHWSKAWGLRVSAEALPMFSVGRLSISHFYVAADFVGRLGLEAVVDWLRIAQEDGWSSRKLGAELSTAANDSGTRPWLLARLGLVSSKLSNLYTMSEQAGFSERERRRLRRICGLVAGMINPLD